MELALIGDLLVVAEEDHGAPVIPSATEEAAMYGAWIIREKPFPKDNREIGHEVVCQLLEKANCPWPRRQEDAVTKRMIEALEAGTISEAEFVDWVCLRVAVAEEQAELRV